MLTYVELARRRSEIGTAQESPCYPPPPLAAHSASPMTEHIEQTVEQIRKPDGSLVTKTTNTTTYPNGSMRVETEEVPIPQAKAEAVADL